ncbi:DUF1837 domain-containing protein [Capnocytophaga leadbetteri]|uniref:HamA C-terminal domain-containing protein n=1 Tax=Capnocytophaga leadbetteri TaxID=327575 RepID=UPI0028EA089E|nr:DUF1837 domain-containing protein [Capnocytophaga leadbetteri]
MNIYLTHTDSLMNHIFWFYEDLNIEPRKDHYGLSINYSDIKERRDDFLKELLSTIVNWVYNKSKLKKILDERSKDTDLGNALNFITNQAYSKFRPGHPQGQFGELLLFNLIQHYYKATPILRKQRITTSIGHERFGADAIHYKNKNDKNIFILGESKCYESKYQFKRAFEISIQSIVKTFNELDKELDLYLYDDFIEPELEELIKKYKQGKLENIQYELVCLIAYNEKQDILGNSEKIIKSNIKKVIQDKCASINKNSFSNIEKNILARVNYIIFPIWELDRLLDDFQNKVGSKK